MVELCQVPAALLLCTDQADDVSLGQPACNIQHSFMRVGATRAVLDDVEEGHEVLAIGRPSCGHQLVSAQERG